MKRGQQFTRELREPRPGEIEAFLSRHVRKIEPINSRGEIRFAPCPSCQNLKRKGGVRSATSADVNLKTGLWRCFGCGVTGNWLTLTRAFGDELPRSDRYKDQRPEDLWKLRDHYASQKRVAVTSGKSGALLDYCHSRGITNATLDRFLVSIALWPKRDCPPPEMHEALRWPLHAWEGGKWVMVNAKLKKCLNRDDDEERSRFGKAGGPTQLAIGQHLISAKHGERILLWEGEFDAMVADQIGLGNSVSIPNGASAIHVDGILRYIPEEWPVYLGMDMDAAGDRAVELFFSQLDPKRIRRFMLPENPSAEPDASGKRPPYKDLNDWYLGTGGLLTAEDVMKTVVGLGVMKPQTAPAPVSFAQIQLKVATRSDVEKPRLVCSLPWPALNEILKGGLLSKQTTGFLAPSGIGKTTAVNQIAIHAAAQGCKTGLISLEDSRDDLYENINQAAVGTLQVDDIARAADNLWVSQLEGSSVAWEEIIDELDRMADAGCRLAIVDNLDHTADRSNQHSGMDMKITAYAAMVELAKRRDMHLIAVWQCKKIDRDQVVNSGNQKGYGQTFLDAANYINMNRLIVGGAERSRLEVEKARAGGTSFTKRHVWLQYVEAKRSFLQVDGNVVSMQSSGSSGLAPF